MQYGGAIRYIVCYYSCVTACVTFYVMYIKHFNRLALISAIFLLKMFGILADSEFIVFFCCFAALDKGQI